MIQGCFSNPGSPNTTKTPSNAHINSSTFTSSPCSSTKQTLITCIYLTRLLDASVYLTLTWSKTPNSHTLTLHLPDCFSLTLSLHHPTFSLFRNRPGSKSILLHGHGHPQCGKLKIYYDFTRAESTPPNSAQPGSRFYLALVCDGRVDFFLGDMAGEFTRRLGVSRLGALVMPTMVSRREHVYGRRSYSTRADLAGLTRRVEIECAGGAMKVKFDDEMVLHVKRLAWKFRGNERIFVNGVGIEFYWDVFNWVNNGGNCGNGGNGVFVFQVGDGGVLPEIVGAEKKLMRKNSPSASVALSPAGSSSSSVLQWAEESSDCGRSSSGSSSTTARSSGSFGGTGAGCSDAGFSLVLYAWRRD